MQINIKNLSKNYLSYKTFNIFQANEEQKQLMFLALSTDRYRSSHPSYAWLGLKQS